MASYNGCNGFIWHSFLLLPMIRPAKQLTFKRRRKRKNMLPFLFQNVEKASYSVFIFFADCLWHKDTQLIMSSLFVAVTGLQFRCDETMSKNGIATARFQYSLAVSAGAVPLRLTRGRSSADPTNSERRKTFVYKRSTVCLWAQNE